MRIANFTTTLWLLLASSGVHHCEAQEEAVPDAGSSSNSSIQQNSKNNNNNNKSKSQSLRGRDASKHDGVAEDKNRMDVPNEPQGFSNLEPLMKNKYFLDNNKTQRKPKADKKTISSSTSTSNTNTNANANPNPKTHSQLNNIHASNQKKAKKQRIDEDQARQLNEKNNNSNCSGQQLIVTCKEDTEANCLQGLQDANIEIVHLITNTDYFAICVEADDDIRDVQDMLDVENVEPDPPRTLSVLPNSERKLQLNRNQQTIPYGVELVRAIEFKQVHGKAGEGVVVCVIDTGLFREHQDFAGLDMDGSDSNDLVRPWFQDGSSHGTHVTGTIAAQDNGRGVVGVAPEVTIYTARVFDDASRFTATSLIAAMQVCHDTGNADIITMSLGGAGFSRAERNQVNRLTNQKNILLVAASGNDGDNANRVEYPAGYDNVMSVGALNKNSQIAKFSSHNTQVSISAPGVQVLSSTSVSTRSYSEFDGTSMAAPHVAGVAALLKSKFPDRQMSAIRTALENSANDVNNGACGYDRLFGHGMVDAMAAAEYLENGNTGGSSGNSAQSDCVNAQISIKTDDYGDETTYVITKKDDPNTIVYRGGPYPRGERATFVDNIQLAPGCYEFRLKDSYGDGSCCNPQFGRGEYKVQYNGQQQFFDNNFQTTLTKSDFGSCGNSGGGDNGGDNGGDSDGGGDSGSGNGNGNSNPAPAVCGNGIVETGEECDDNNQINTDACTNECRNARCGDGIVQTGVEGCDDGNNNNNDSCTNACERARCGDAIIQTGVEECDDGNQVNNDSCSNSCVLPSCGDGIRQPGEDCDDGNQENTDSCTNECKVARCGDGFLQPGEGCDDGDTRNGDGCDSSCQVEGVGGGLCPNGESLVELILETDPFSWSENELYMFDQNAADDDFIWIATARGIRSNYQYSLNECIRPSSCYKFFFFDTYGDGLANGGLILKYNGQTILDIKPDEVGDKWQQGTSAVYWKKSLGTCGDDE